jgi:hypothetical protein
MNEPFPVLYGVGVSLVSSVVGSRPLRYLCWGALSALFGVAATFFSGEWRMGWEFLLIDIPLVAGSSLAVIALAGSWVRAKRRRISARG